MKMQTIKDLKYYFDVTFTFIFCISKAILCKILAESCIFWEKHETWTMFYSMYIKVKKNETPRILSQERPWRPF